MNKICTSIEQSKKLLKLGIDVGIADMCYRYKWHNNNFILLPCIEKAKEPITGDIPAWSLTALLELMPKEEYKDLYLCFGGYCGNEYFSEWFCSYVEQDSFIIIKECHTDNLIDVAFQMVCWLKENGKI